MAKSKLYAVCIGREGPKIYTDWEECKANTSRYPGAKHKAFSSRVEAERWIEQNAPRMVDSDSDIEFIQGPSTQPARAPPTRSIPPIRPTCNYDSDSDIEFVAHVPAIPVKKPPQSPPTTQPETLTPGKADPIITLSPEQAKVLELVKQGKNVFYTGSAGTGKSVLLREIIQWFNQSGKTLAITASTGIAATNIGGTTIHSWAGIGLGQDPAHKMAVKFFANAERFRGVLSRWHKVHALIIDEISMLDGSLFDMLQDLARRIRSEKKELPFGGIQLILSGDFCQLPPVPSRNEKGVTIESRFTFEAKSWEACVGPPIVLQKVFRQKDQHFVDMLNSMRFGNLDPSASDAFRALSRTVIYDDGIEPSELFPTRREVDNANTTRLKKLKTEEKTYHSSDVPGTDADGKQIPWAKALKTLERLVVAKLITVKLDAQVMLVKNLHDIGLVNGSIGKVVGFHTIKDAVQEGITIGRVSRGEGNEVSLDKDPAVAKVDKTRVWPVVRFTGGKTLLCIPLDFSVNDATGKPEATRTQVPLILAWALSIHKSQGQTLERVKVDLKNIFEKGQAYVALSRATKMEQLQVLNFDPLKVQAHPRVLTWYRAHTKVHKSTHVSDEPEIDEDFDLYDEDISTIDMDELDSQEAMEAYYS